VLNSLESLTPFEKEINDVILAYLKAIGSDATSIDTHEDLVDSGKLDSFDSVSLMAELESKYGKSIKLSEDMGKEFRVSVSWLAKLFSTEDET
jgi:acyl carrier protein